ncbi:MAG TPA: tRNA (adenosine(37)-N6)-threonylcarbamoyltransferase complex ATPase subunit type 1 TsaE [Candidatus Limnocylindria bacterium]|nr:tRNA (adenosine(37)-N6)-threonylcarbamoyltransferase complex ATPase subunit type 1 TsaE [Candidatus Limnocylindria bacterium]
MGSMKLQISTTGAGQTEAIAEKIGRALRGGEVIELVSDLGGGKTTFTRGLARGAGSPDRVASPTFTISKVYRGTNLEIHHFDFYRLADAGLMEHELHDVIGDPGVVVVVEWGDVVAHVLPDDRLTIQIRHTGDDSRGFELSHPEELTYLVEGL